ncbi:MAG TPA: DNA gyrase inhibitor YacG [Candidatus Acidoferrales bacterium]|nr:DNA gyrase inhibitor YacG [Candidatus Acidoferrales bacterium]
MKRRCPICGATTESVTHPEFPFCSERCRLLDLGNWASEKYVITEPAIDEDPPDLPGRNIHDRENDRER